MNALTWITWGLTATLAVTTTRNPYYLTLALTSVASTYWAVDRVRPLGRRPTRLPIRLGALVVVVSIAFNALTAHVGDIVLWRLPPRWPIVGGAITLNAVVYGVLTGIVLLTVLVVTATLDGALNRYQALRLVPSSFGTVATVLVLGFTVFPLAVRAVRDVRDAQASRGLGGSPVARARVMLVPVLHRALEHAFDVAETLECRGFGAGSHPSRSRWLPLLATTALGVSVLGNLVGRSWLALTGTLGAVGVLATLAVSARHHLRRVPWDARDACCLAVSMGAGAALLLLLTAWPGSLAYSTYPTLEWPVFEPLIGAAYLAPAAPALLVGRPDGEP